MPYRVSVKEATRGASLLPVIPNLTKTNLVLTSSYQGRGSRSLRLAIYETHEWLYDHPLSQYVIRYPSQFRLHSDQSLLGVPKGDASFDVHCETRKTTTYFPSLFFYLSVSLSATSTTQLCASRVAQLRWQSPTAWHPERHPIEVGIVELTRS